MYNIHCRFQLSQWEGVFEHEFDVVLCQTNILLEILFQEVLLLCNIEPFLELIFPKENFVVNKSLH